MSHEHAILEDIILNAEKQGKVKGVLVDCGALAELPAHELEEALLARKPNWRVEVIETPALVQCKECGYEGEPEILERAHDFVLYACPQCSSEPEVLAGKEIMLKKVFVE